MQITSFYPVLMVDDVATAARFYREAGVTLSAPA